MWSTLIFLSLTLATSQANPAPHPTANDSGRVPPGAGRTAPASHTASNKPEAALVAGKRVAVAERAKISVRLVGKQLQVLKGAELTGTLVLPRIPLKYALIKHRFYAACGSAGLYVIDVVNPSRPRVVSVIDKGRNVVDFSIKGEVVIAVAAKYNVETYRLGAGGKPMPLVDIVNNPGLDRKLFGRRAMQTRIGVVVRVTKGWATIRLKPDVKIKAGDRVEVRSQRSVAHFSPLRNSMVKAPTKEVVCVARVQKIKAALVAISLGRGDAPEPGDFVYFSDKSITGSLWLPARQRDIWRGGFELYPLFSSGGDASSSLFFSAVMRATMDYHGIKPYHLQLALDPVQFIGSSQFDMDKRLGGNLTFVASYEEKQFEIGLGIGYQIPLLNGLSSHNRSGVVLVQMMRLGARDGVNLTAKFQSVYSDDNSDNRVKAMVGIFLGELNIPMSRSVNLFTRYMGDGRTLNTFSLGLKTFLLGNGGPGTIIVPVSIGYSSISPYYTKEGSTTQGEDQFSLAGVTFSLGVEQRF